jgi:hypothetical protein
MKISKELHHITSNHIPKGAVEGWPKAIGTGTAVDTHRPKGVPRLRLSEGSLKGVQTSHWGKNTMKVEVPNRGGRCAEKLTVEAVEDRSLLVVVEKRAPTIMKYVDLVPTQAGRGARMEEPGVVLTQTTQAKREPLPPVGAQAPVLHG